MPDVPVCAGRGEQKPCRWYETGVAKPATWRDPMGGSSGHKCTAFYDVVTGAADRMDCHTARGDQLLCGREGKMYEAGG